MGGTGRGQSTGIGKGDKRVARKGGQLNAGIIGLAQDGKATRTWLVD